jgi:hypothetical protein
MPKVLFLRKERNMNARIPGIAIIEGTKKDIVISSDEQRS